MTETIARGLSRSSPSFFSARYTTRSCWPALHSGMGHTRWSIKRRLHTSPKVHDPDKAKRPRLDDKASFKDPLTRYHHLVDTGVLRADEHQVRIIQKLQRLWQDLVDYNPGPLPPETSKPSLFSRFFSSKLKTPQPTVPLSTVPKGLYLHGSVGTGKTMLMDLFHSTLPPQFREGAHQLGSTRIHFHSFMLDVLQRQHEVSKRYEEMGQGKRDAMPEVARSLAERGRVVCFDEFQVTDIVTAMILRQLLERLMGFGVVFVMTSNRHPDELYKNGIQRSSFIPAIEMIKDRFEIVDLNSETDYRKLPRALSHTYYHPLQPSTHSELSKLFHSLASTDPISTQISTTRKIPLWGRQLSVPSSSGTIARFRFGDLCARPLSAADYLELTYTFGTIFVEEVPRIGLSERDQARRFITFIDACYENKTKLFISSEVPIYQIFSDDKAKSATDDEHMASVMDELGLSAEDVGTSSLFTGQEELFAFARCVSRLSEMGTQEWANSSGLLRTPPKSEVSETD